MAAEVDFLIVAASASPGTENIVNRQVFDKLGPDGTLINISRGSLVDETDLIAALEAGQIRAAGLDVFANEPAIPAALATLPNVVLQPHAASATWETRQAMGKVVTDNLERFYNNRPLLTEYLR